MKSRGPWRNVRQAMMAVVLAAGAAVVLAPAPAALADAAGQGGDYVPLQGTQRVLDTGTGVGAPKATIGAAGVVTFQVTGVGRIPAGGVRAVLVDITTRAPTANTWLTIWPGDVTARPGVVNHNVMAGETLSNSAVVELGANGKLSVYNQAGKTGLTVDVQGYFTKQTGLSGPGGFVPVPSNPTVVSGTIAANATRTVNVLGGVVPAGSPAIFADVQVVNATAAGWLRTQPVGGASDSTMEFVTGNNSHGAVLRPAADGQLNITNYSSAQISILVRLQGYFTASSTTGAGLRPLIRRLSDTTMPANGTLDLAVGGTNGLPLRGVAGAALNFMANTAPQNGYLKAWPLNSPEPASSVNTFRANKIRSGMAIIKPGFEGKIRVKNVSNGSVRVFIDLQGWFADPLPTVPSARYSPTTVVQPPGVGSALGAIQYAYVDNIGQAKFGYQDNPNNFSAVQWTAPPSPNAFTGQPGASAYPDGRVQVTVQNSDDGDYWTASQKAATGPTYNPWGDLGGSMASTPTQVTLSSNVVVNFGVDSDGKLWHHRLLPGSGSFWRGLGDQDLVGPISYAPVQQGVQIFARDMSGSVRTALYDNDGSLGAWSNLNAVGVNDKPAVVVYPGSRVRVFVRAGDGTVQTKLREANGTWPADWVPVGTFTAAGAPAAILDPVLGRVAVVARGSDNEIYVAFETAQGSGAWGNWQWVSKNGSDPMVTEPTVAPVTLGSGQSWVIVSRNINDATRVWERRIDDVPLLAKGSQAAKNSAVPSFTVHRLPAPPAD